MWPSLCYYPVTNPDHSHYFQEVHDSSIKTAQRRKGFTQQSLVTGMHPSRAAVSVWVKASLRCVIEHLGPEQWNLFYLKKKSRCSAKDRGNPFHLQQNHFSIREVQKDCLLCNQNIVYLLRRNNTLQLPKCCQSGVKTKLRYKTWTTTCHPPSRDSSKGFFVVSSAQPNLFDCWVKLFAIFWVDVITGNGTLL